MNYRYVAAYKVFGIAYASDQPDRNLVEILTIGARAKLTSNIDSACFNLDRGIAIASVMLKSLFGQQEPGIFNEKLASAIKDIQEKRKKEFGEGAFLIFEVSSASDLAKIEPQKDYGDFAICFDAVSKAPIKRQYASELNGVLSALSLVVGDEYEIQKVVDGVYFLDDSGKVIYSFTSSVSGTLSVSRPITDDAVSFVSMHSQTLGTDSNLAKISRLLTQSLEKNNDNLRSFIAAWAALEIFTNTTFNHYERTWFNRFTGSHAPILSQEYFNRIREVMHDKYKLADKFLVICSQLSDGLSAEQDIEEFKALKKFRDNLLHGYEVSDGSLPTQRVQALLRRYLKRHIEMVRV